MKFPIHFARVMVGSHCSISQNFVVWMISLLYVPVNMYRVDGNTQSVMCMFMHLKRANLIFILPGHA